MTALEILKRNEKSQNLSVLQADDGSYFVESAEGKIAYKVEFNGEQPTCTCGDYTRGVKKDENFICKHILAVLSSSTSNRDQSVPFNGKQHKPKLDDRFILKLQGKEFVLYSGLLDLAHQKGLSMLEVEVIQFPTADNGMEAICKATAESLIGNVFSDVGDASPKNVNRAVALHILRMASTRAKARVLRDMVNVGMTSLEEICDIEDVIPGQKRDKAPAEKKMNGGTKFKLEPKPTSSGPIPRVEAPAEPSSTSQVQKESPNPVAEVAASIQESTPSTAPVQKKNNVVSMSTMSEAQKRAISNLARRRGITETELEDLCQKGHGVNVAQLMSADASIFIRNLQQSA
jgi:hypothetical protein